MRETSLKVGVRLAAVVLFAALGTAVAQFERVGVITATLDGEARIWYVLSYDGEDGSDSTATLEIVNFGVGSITSLNVQGHAEEWFSVEGALVLGGTALAALEDCPCTLTGSEIMYFATSSMFKDVYVSIDSELTIETFAMIAEDVASLSGTFSALLGFVENPVGPEEPDPERAIAVQGEFVIERMMVRE